MATWVWDEPEIMPQAITDVSTTQYHPLGTIKRGKDVGSSALGSAEFIYLKGVTSNAAGLFVTFNAAFVAALATTSLTVPAPHAISMSAFDSSTEYGWAMISGQYSGVSKSAAASFAALANFAASAGIVVAQATGRVVHGGCVVTVASAKSDVTTCTVLINRPKGSSDVS